MKIETLPTLVVPEAKDGSRFTPDLVLWDGSYRIGAYRDEFPVQGYLAALAVLAEMEAPYWRRPSRTSGISGVVKGVRWVTLHRDSNSIEPTFSISEGGRAWQDWRFEHSHHSIGPDHPTT